GRPRAARRARSPCFPVIWPSCPPGPVRPPPCVKPRASVTFVMSGDPPPPRPGRPAEYPESVLEIGPYTTLRLGGRAGRMGTAGDHEEIVKWVRDAPNLDEPRLVLAGGSNVVVGDAGFDGTVLLVRSVGIRFEAQADGSVLVTAEAGQPWDEVVRASL